MALETAAMKTSLENRLTRLLPVLALVLVVGGCDTVKNTLGLNKSSPDESRVTVFSPLVVPPDFNLRPPGPGGVQQTAAPRTGKRVTSVAIGQDGRIVTSVTGTGPEGATSGELALLRSAGAMSPPEGIRDLAAAQEQSLAKVNTLLTDLVLFNKRDADQRQLDPRELSKIDTLGLF